MAAGTLHLGLCQLRESVGDGMPDTCSRHAADRRSYRILLARIDHSRGSAAAVPNASNQDHEFRFGYRTAGFQLNRRYRFMTRIGRSMRYTVDSFKRNRRLRLF